MKHYPGRYDATISSPGEEIVIKHLEFGKDGQIVKYEGSHPMHITFYPGRVELMRVKDRGSWYNPPAQHLGQPLQNSSPLDVAELGLKFYTAFVAEAEAKFFPSS